MTAKKCEKFVLNCVEDINVLHVNFVYPNIPFFSSKKDSKEESEINFFEVKDNGEITIVKNSSDKKLPCFGCHRKNYKGIPLGVPIDIEKKGSNYLVKCIDNACSFNCMITIANERKLQYTPIFDLYHILKRKEISEIRPSPSWRLLKEYGGILTDEEYEKQLTENYTITSLKLGSANNVFYSIVGEEYVNTM